MTFKTVAYVFLALLVAYGLLKVAWRVSGDVMQQPVQETVAPPVKPKPMPETKPVTADPSAGMETADTPSDNKAEPEVAEEPARKADGDEGYYDDGISSEPSAIKQHRQDKQDPYQPDEREAEKETAPRQFPDDDREVDRPADAEQGTPANEIDRSKAYEPDLREAN